MKLQEKTKKSENNREYFKKFPESCSRRGIDVIERLRREQILRINSYDWYGDHRLKIGQRYFLLEHLTSYIVRIHNHLQRYQRESNA